MANVKDENPDFDELKLPGEEEEAVPVEPLADDLLQEFQPLDASEFPEPAAEESAFGPPVETEGGPVETEEASQEPTPEEGTAEEPAEGPAKPSRELPPKVEWGAVAGVSVLLFVLALAGLLYFATAIYVISIGMVGYGIWKGRETNSVYTVFLGCTLVAVLTAIYCLWMELGRYHYDVKAREARQRVSFSAPTLLPEDYV